MTDPAGSPRDALERAIGHYVTTFANLETIVATHIGYVLELPHTIVFFIVKDMFFDHKVKLLSRAVEQKFGMEKTMPYRAALNRARDAGETRNALLHGAFAQEGETQLRGRLGESLTKFDEGLKRTGYAEIEEATRLVDEASAALIAAFPDEGENPSSSSSLEASGFGDQ